MSLLNVRNVRVEKSFGRIKRNTLGGDMAISGQNSDAKNAVINGEEENSHLIIDVFYSVIKKNVFR